MRRFTNFFVLTLCIGVGVATAQKRYDELTFPELNTFRKPDVETFALDNGIQFFLVEDDELPLLDVTVNIRVGGVLVPEDKTGLASITGTVIRSGGTEQYPADSLNQILENRAASMETGIDFTSGSASMNVLKEDFDDLLPVFVDLLQNPAFPRDKIELAKTRQKSAISRRNDNQQQIAFREFERLIYGKKSIYGQIVEYETINNISRDDLISFHNNHFTGRNMLVGVVGDFDTASMKKKLAKAFAEVPAGAQTDLHFPEIDYTYNRSINFIDKPDVNQSFVLLGHLGGLRSNPDYPEVQVMNEVLSGGFSGRLFQVVRSDLGLAYAVFGRYGMNTFYRGQFYAGVLTKSSTTAEAIDAIVAQIKRLQNEPITEQELRDVKDQYLNSMVFRFDSYEEVLGRRLSNEYLGLPEDAFERFIEEVRNTTIEDVQTMARKYLRPDALRILVVGNKQEIGTQLQKYGEVNEIDITIPQPGSDSPEKLTGDAEKGRALLDRMASSLIAPGQSLDSLTIQAELTEYNENIPGGKMNLEITATINYPDAITQTIETPNGTLTLNYSDGEGTMEIMGQQRPLNARQIQGLKETLNRSYLAVAKNSNNLASRYLGTTTFDGKKYAKLAVKVGEETLTYLIDPETGLPRLMRYRRFDPQQGEEMEIEERYSDWKTRSGVTYAYKEVTYRAGEKSSEATYETHRINK